MPRVVDRDERRLELVKAASRVLVRHGIDAMTTRRITDEAGVAKGTLGHYFDSKAELVAELVRFHHRRSGRRFLLALEADPGVDGLRNAMLETLPLDDDRLADAVVEVAFASITVGNTDLLGSYRRERHELHELLRQRLDDLRTAGDGDPAMDPDDGATELLSLMDGLSLQAVLLSRRAHRGAQVRQLDALLERLCPPTTG